MASHISEMTTSTNLSTSTASSSTALDNEDHDTKTTSITRKFSDLDGTQYLSWVFAFSVVRAILFHPFVLILTRKHAGIIDTNLSTWRALQILSKEQGGYVSATSMGLTASILGLGVSECVNMGLMEYLRQNLPFQSDIFRDGIGAYASDAASHFFDIPVQIIATLQMIDKTGVKRNMVHWCRHVLREQGIRGMWASYGTTLLGGSSWGGLWWIVYQQSKAGMYHVLEWAAPNERDYKDSSWAVRLLTSKSDNAPINVAASVVASASTTAMFNPFCVVRTRLQCASHLGSSSFTSVVRDVYHTRGLRGFFVGTCLNICTNVIDGALIALTYESAKLLSDKT